MLSFVIKTVVEDRRPDLIGREAAISINCRDQSVRKVLQSGSVPFSWRMLALTSSEGTPASRSFAIARAMSAPALQRAIFSASLAVAELLVARMTTKIIRIDALFIGLL